MTDENGWKNQAKRTEKTRVVTARLSVGLVGKVDAIAAENATDRTAIVRHQLEKFVDEQARAVVEKTERPADLFE